MSIDTISRKSVERVIEATVFPSYPIPAWCPQLGNAGFREGVNDLSARYRCFRGVFPEVPRRAAIIQGMPSQSKERRRTEQRNAASKNLDRMNASQIVRMMNRE